MSNDETTSNDGTKQMSVLQFESKEKKEARKARIKEIVWRDFVFFALAVTGSYLMSYVEVNASKAELRSGHVDATKQKWDYSTLTSSSYWCNCGAVIDTGYILTTPLYNFLKENRGWNDFLAALNSLFLVIPGIYTAWITLWKGDYDLIFRYFATHLLRSFCGWFTYLPPDPSYLPSNYDFPDIWQCFFVKDCSQAEAPEALPFVSFFSGHCSTLICTANHMYVHGYKRLGIVVHVMNALQIIRFLATRGHYSIDIIIAWFVAVYVSNPAGRLGRYYSKGAKLEEIMPAMNAQVAFEKITGISDNMVERRISKFITREDLKKLLQEIIEDDGVTDQIMLESSSETTATLLAKELEKMNAEKKKAKIK